MSLRPFESNTPRAIWGAREPDMPTSLLASYLRFLREHRLRIRTNKPLERIIREMRRRTRVVVSLPEGHSARMLSAFRLDTVAGTRWGTRK